MSSKMKIDVVDAQSLMRARGSNALAVALITGIGEAEENGRPLTELQQEDMATMAIMAYEQLLEGVQLMAVKLPGRT